MVPFELYRSEICNTNQFKWVDQTRRTRGDVSEPANRSCSMSVICVWKPDLSAYWSHFQRAAQERSAWTRSPTAAEMKGTAWRNISRPSSSRHRKPFFKTSDPTAKSNAFTRPPLWHICQEKIHVCVEREKKKKSSPGKSRRSFINKRKSTVHYTAAAQGYRRIKDTRTLDSKEKLNKRRKPLSAWSTFSVRSSVCRKHFRTGLKIIYSLKLQ